MRLILGLLVLCSSASAEVVIRNAGSEFRSFWMAAKEQPFDKQYQLFDKHLLAKDEYREFYRQVTYSYVKDAEWQNALRDDLKEWVAIYKQKAAEIQKLFTSFNVKSKDILKGYKTHFPDFKENFAIYGVPSLGRFGGRVRNPTLKLPGAEKKKLTVVALGVDKLVDQGFSFKTLFAHELFHAYHWQVSPHLGPDGNKAPLIRHLWVEGLAVHVSKVLNPSENDMGSLLGFHEIGRLCNKNLRKYAQLFLKETAGINSQNWQERKGEALMKRWYLGNKEVERKDPKIPDATGYCIGYHVAKNLGKTNDLHTMAKWKFDTLLPKVQKQLRLLAAQK